MVKLFFPENGNFGANLKYLDAAALFVNRETEAWERDAEWKHPALGLTGMSMKMEEWLLLHFINNSNSNHFDNEQWITSLNHRSYTCCRDCSEYCRAGIHLHEPSSSATAGLSCIRPLGTSVLHDRFLKDLAVRLITVRESGHSILLPSYNHTVSSFYVVVYLHFYFSIHWLSDLRKSSC